MLCCSNSSGNEVEVVAPEPVEVEPDQEEPSKEEMIGIWEYDHETSSDIVTFEIKDVGGRLKFEEDIGNGERVEGFFQPFPKGMTVDLVYAEDGKSYCTIQFEQLGLNKGTYSRGMMSCKQKLEFDDQWRQELQVSRMPPPELPGPQGLPLTFKDPESGSTNVFWFTRRPLGFHFVEGKTPIKISKVDPEGHAADFGIKVGMLITAVNGEDITAMDYNQFLTKIQEAKASKIHKGVVKSLFLSFQNETNPNEYRTFAFTRSPLGIKFSENKQPIVITEIDAGGHADELGVKKGMVLEAIYNERTRLMSYDEFFKKMSDAVVPFVGA